VKDFIFQLEKTYKFDTPY